MQTLSRGQRLKFADIGLSDAQFTIDLELGLGGLTVDSACFGLNASRQLDDERYMTFFNQPSTPCGAVQLVSPGRFDFDLGRLPASVVALTLTLAIDGVGAMSSLARSCANIIFRGQPIARFDFGGELFSDERAVMVIEIYRKDGLWRLSPVGQGFNGGLDALVQHFGGDVAPPVQPVATTPAPSKVSLEKRIEKEAPQLLSLVKKASISLEKAGLSAHRARVCLCLDISGSMSNLYKSGAVQQFAERILALACRFDDDGAIDVFLFGANVHAPEPMTLSNSSGYVASLTRKYPLEGDTRYGRAMEAIRDFYFKDIPATGSDKVRKAETPVYVMFVTDGGTSDKGLTERQLCESSHEPIFWQFMGIGKGRKSKNKMLQAFADSNFPFLEKLDDLPGRLMDNAGFFSVERPDEHPDEALFDLLMDEYPDWVKLARSYSMFL
jgi:stress response protein SCP2